MPKIPYIKRVAAAALTSVDAVLNRWVPGGHLESNEYVVLNPMRNDKSEDSFKINRRSGKWKDFAVGDDAKGEDLVSLVAYLESYQGKGAQLAAAKLLAAFLGLPDETDPPERATTVSKKPGNSSPLPDSEKTNAAPVPPGGGSDGGDWRCVMPAPNDAPEPPIAHSRHGQPSRRYAYLAQDGRINFYHDRYDKSRGERKQFSPLTLWQKGDKYEWRFKVPPGLRPLYGLPGLVQFPVAECWFVEGEKAAEALQKLLPDHPVLCWQGGSQAVEKSDYTPLTGRDCVIFPDYDLPGTNAAGNLVKRLTAAGVRSARVLNIDRLERAAGEPLQPGDDAADLVACGWDADRFAEFLRRDDAFLPGADVGGGVDEARPASKSDEKQSEIVRRGFELFADGVYLLENTRDGGFRPRKICAPLHVLARSRTIDGKDWGLLVQFHDPDGRTKKIILPMKHFSGDAVQITSMLLNEGLHIEPQGKRYLIEYLQVAEVKKHVRISDRSGWHGEADEMVYLFHDAFLGVSSEEWLCSNPPEDPIFKQRGSLAQWQEKVSGLCIGNSRLVFGISAAFSAPLIHLVGGENAGIHFRGSSSCGKTTILRVASSVCGGADYMLQWRSTDNSMETVAQLHTDALLAMDELKQLDPRVANEVFYMLGNGSGKNRNKAEGGNRRLIKWRSILLSTGEISLAQHLNELGKRVHAGAEIRLNDIQADSGAGMGAFENIHGFELPSRFAETLNANAAKYYGVAFVEFVKHLIDKRQEIIPMLKECETAFTKATLSDQASGQVRRVASRFSLIAAGGELATNWGITGWQPGEAMQAGITCFKAWLQAFGGEGNREERAMIEQVGHFLELHGEARFTDSDRANADDNHAPKTLNRAGFREKNHEGELEFFCLPEVFKAEICKGFDSRAVARLLIERGYMKPGDGRNLATKKRLPGCGMQRVFHILPTIWSSQND